MDTDYAGTLPAFYKSAKNAGIALNEITYVAATHYHPDHMGLIGELISRGVKLLLLDTQADYVHYSDGIFKKDNICCSAIDETAADVISCKDSRSFLASIGIAGEIISTPSHSKDSVTLVSDCGNCFVGDLEPYEYIDGYEDNEALRRDWKRIMAFNPKTVYYAHRPEMIIG